MNPGERLGIRSWQVRAMLDGKVCLSFDLDDGRSLDFMLARDDAATLLDGMRECIEVIDGKRKGNKIN